MAGMAATLDRFCAAHDLRPWVLGYSMGGRVALSWAVETDSLLAGLLLVGASPGLREPSARAARRREDFALAARLRRDGIEQFAEEWERTPLIRSQARIPQGALEPLRARRRKQDPEGLARALEGYGTSTMPSLWERLGEITVPVLLATGAEDAKFSALAADMARAHPVILTSQIPAAGHCAHLEKMDTFAAVLNLFTRV